MKLSIILISGLLVSNTYSQTSKRQFVFAKNDKVYIHGLSENAVRFTPSINEVNTADSLAQIHIVKNRKAYSLGGRDI
jgi:hypothetical protein